jgi:hypothetical protein
MDGEPFHIHLHHFTPTLPCGVGVGQHNKLNLLFPFSKAAANNDSASVILALKTAESELTKRACRNIE